MKKVLLLAILVSSSLFAQAQKSKKSPEERAQERVEKISQELNLTDTQEKEIYALFLSEGKKGQVKGKSIRDLNQEERQAYINAKKEEKAIVYEKIAKILDEDQFATFQSMDKTRRPIRVNPSHAGAGKGKKDPAARIQNRVDKLTEKLQLSETQQDQVSSILTKRQDARKTKEENTDMSEEAKEARKAARKDAKAQLDAEMKAVLSAEQYATYQEEGKDKMKRFVKLNLKS